MCGAAFVALALATGSAQAQAASGINIAPQSLDTALNELGAQSNQQVLIRSDVATGKMTRGVVGAPSFEVALAGVLEGTGLTFRREGDTFLIVQGGSADPQSGSAAGDGADGTVEALIVTAQKREEDIQDVPIAISAFTQEQLTDRQVAGGPDLMTQVPNMTFTKTNFSSYSIQIRGIGTQAISATTDPAVAVAFNNTPFVRNRFFEQEFYDLQRVEVLRGPQGTLYGRNATAGVVNIISAKPSFGYEAKLSGDVSNYNSTRIEGMVNVPLVEDKVALRLAGAWTKRDGYSTNEITGNPIDGRDLWSTRLSLRFSPTDRIDANLIWEHFEEDDDRLRSGKQLCHQDDRDEIGGYFVPPINGYSALFSQGCLPASLYSPDSFEAPNGLALPYYLPLSALSLPVIPGFNPYASLTQSPDLRVIESTVDPEYRARSDVFELQINVDLNDVLTLSSETAYSTDFIFSTQDFNRFNTASGAFADSWNRREGVVNPGPNGGVFCDPQIGCADRVVAVDLSTAESRHFSQEFRLASNYDGPFNFSLGSNFLRYDTEDKYYVFINTLTMFAAGYLGFGAPDALPWNPTVDNSDCLPLGFREPDPTAVHGVTGCKYIDTNPIGSLNDLGHNYFLSKNPYKLISYAVFGEAYYNINENLKVTAGLRWTVDKKEAPRIPSWVLGADTVGYPVMEVVRQEWREPTGRLTVDWKPDLAFTDETLLYASYAHGYKAGGANPPPPGTVVYGSFGDIVVAGLVTKPRTFEPEFVDAFELGSKNTMFDGRLTLNLAAFYYDYKDYQISQIIDRSAVNYNFDATVWGLEIEADWRPLENLKLGFKGGYENTKVGDGEQAIDIMERNAGHGEGTDDVWVVVRPFPTQPSNCIVPLYALLLFGDRLGSSPVSYVNGQPGPCEAAYLSGNDPVTNLPYVPNPTVSDGNFSLPFYFPGYVGFDPATAPNNGEGFFKDLSGNELPNAPHFTATITADYTVPLPNDWLATLHTDLYYQSEAWTRIFNMEGYDKLKAYTNVNLAAIFTNEDAGWKVMAYVKNVFDRDSITGAFLNSDDTGLTTNVFLTEPRLYGLRVTKEWNGGPWWTGANPNHTGPYPLTVELGGQVQRHDAPYEPVVPGFGSAFSGALGTPQGIQNRDLDRGDGREVKLTWRPQGPWIVSAGLRYGRTNTDAARAHGEQQTEGVCPFAGKYAVLCDPTSPYYLVGEAYQTNFSDSFARQREEYQIADFTVGRDLGIGESADLKSTATLGLRYAQMESSSEFEISGIPDWNFPEGAAKYPSSFHRYSASFDVKREFEGVGPTLSWAAAKRLLGDEGVGRLDLDWSVTGGVLFGKQKTLAEGQETAIYYQGVLAQSGEVPQSGDPLITPPPSARSKSVSVPLVDVSLGLSYEIQRIKIGAGYRWERYFDVLDVGFEEKQDADRTIDGPYFKIAVGFGG